MIDIAQQVGYWRTGAAEDWEVAAELVEHGRIRHGLFFAHLALEKVLKAHVCRKTQELAPRIHSLLQLAELAATGVTKEQLAVLAEMNTFQIEGRYPHSLPPVPTPQEAREYLARAGEVLKWLLSQL